MVEKEILVKYNLGVLPKSMDKEVTLKAIIASPDNPDNFTVYLTSRNESVILPINLDKSSAIPVINAIQHKDFSEVIPSIYDTAHKILLVLGGIIQKVLITTTDGVVFSSYLQVRRGERLIEINSKVSDSLSLAFKSGCPIYVTDKAMEIYGFDTKDIS